MKRLFGTLVLGCATFGMLLGSIASVNADFIVVPDLGPTTFYGSGDASVTYGTDTFSTSSALSNGNFFNTGPELSGVPAVLTDQEQTIGVANILITFSSPSTFVSLDYGTFTGSDVTFLLSNGDSFTQGSTGDGYSTPDVFSVNSTPFTSVLITTVDITPGDGVISINDISNSSTVPEPSTFALAGLGGIGLAFGAFRRRAAVV